MNFSKIYSEKHKEKCFSILHNRTAKHFQRIWLVGFLKWITYSDHEICNIIHNHNRWSDYDKIITTKMVHSIHPSKKSYKHDKNHLSSSDMLLHFLLNTGPILPFPVNPECKLAAHQYFNMGFIPLPKDLAHKKPSILWKEFLNFPPTAKQIDAWDFSHGICLLAGNGINFLDIDEKIDHSTFKDRHYEITPRGGTHIFGRGDLPTKNEPTSEIKGIGSLIVCYPTHGYTILHG